MNLEGNSPKAFNSCDLGSDAASRMRGPCFLCVEECNFIYKLKDCPWWKSMRDDVGDNTRLFSGHSNQRRQWTSWYLCRILLKPSLPVMVTSSLCYKHQWSMTKAVDKILCISVKICISTCVKSALIMTRNTLPVFSIVYQLSVPLVCHMKNIMKGYGSSPIAQLTWGCHAHLS